MIISIEGLRSGKPCIKNTRIAVSDIISWLENGMTMNEILFDFPELTEKDILESIAYNKINYPSN